MKKTVITLIFLLIVSGAYSQSTVHGTFSGLSHQMVKLVGIEGYTTYTIDSVRANEKGSFNLTVDKKDYGIGYLVAADNKSFVVLLSSEDLKLKGEAFAFPETIEILKGNQNQIYSQYASEHPRREQSLSAWDYLARIYTKDSLFSTHKIPRQAIEKEKQRIKQEDSLFLASLDQATYVSWFLPIRKLISSVSTIAQYRTEEILTTINAFRNIDYTDKRLYKSGLLGDVIESHFWLIENSGRSLDSMYIEMNISIDYMIENMASDEEKMNEITHFIFKLLEKRSLFKSSEHLALKVLNQTSCILNKDLASQLESYRAMKTGNTAPDFELKGDVFASGYKSDNIPKKLSDLKSKYTLVVFGSSWCPQCPKELSKIMSLYEKWKKLNIEVIFVSLDEEEQTFKNFAKIFPFISSCNYQKWETPVVKDYHVFATPTIYLLNNKREILLRPISVKQIDAWVDLNVVQFNKEK